MCAALIAIVGGLTYLNSLSGPFVLDDQGAIVENAQIRDWSHLGAVLFPPANSSVAGRPIVNLSFAVNYAIGALNVRGYHIWNIVVHLVCAILVFAIVRRTVELPALRARINGRLTFALAVALLWVVHPLNTEAVDYLTQRTESMMAMFFLGTLYASIRAIDAEQSARWRALAIVSCGLGMACKESMVTAPVVVALYDRAYVFGSWKEALKRRAVLYAGLAATWLVLAALIWSGPRAAVGGFSSGVPVSTYLLNQAQMISRYLALATWPRNLVVFYGWPAPVTIGAVWPAALFVVVLLLATIVAWLRKPSVGFLASWFFITLAPSSSIVPIATEVGAERRMYLPLIAVIALAVAGVSWLGQRALRAARMAGQRTAHAIAVVLLVVAVAAFVAGSISRNREYASALTLAQTVVERWPTGVAHHILGEQLMHAGRHDEAIVQFREAAEEGDSRARYALGIELFNQGKFSEAVPELEAFIATWGRRLVPRWLEPGATEIVNARLATGRAFAAERRWTEAAGQAEQVLAVAPSNPDAQRLLAQAAFNQERYEDAASRYREYLRSRPSDDAALIALGVALVASGKIDDAIAAFRQAVEANPRNPAAHRVLAMALLDRGDPEEAQRQAREGLNLSPDDPAMRDVLARAQAARGAHTTPQRPRS